MLTSTAGIQRQALRPDRAGDEATSVLDRKLLRTQGIDAEFAMLTREAEHA
jgi:hypothetical protein